jgi:hypothetical protein
VDLLQGALAHHHPVESIVMANNRLLAAGAADIKLKAIDTVIEREIESGSGVFRCIEPGAAMSEQ